MAFQSMLNGAECSTSNNGLAQMLKHTSQDRSLQHGDRTTAGQPHMGPAGMRQQHHAGPNSDAEAFFRQQQGASLPGTANSAFDMHAMRSELNTAMPAFQRPNAGAAWASQMPRNATPNSADMEAAFARGGAPPASSQWANQFGSSRHQGPAMHHSMNAPGDGSGSSAAYASRPMMGSYGGMGMGGMGGMGMSMGMGTMGGMGGGMATMNAPQQTQSTASRFTELDDAKWEEQFKKLDAEQADTEAKGKGKAKQDEPDLLPSEAEQAESIRRELDAIEQELTADGQEANSRFEDLWRSMNARNGVPPSAADAELAKWEQELLNARTDDDETFGYAHPSGGLGGGRHGLDEMAALDGTEDALLDGFGVVGPDGYPRLGNYRRSQQNPFEAHSDPLSEGLRLLANGGNLSDAALLFEAATQRDTPGGTGGEVERGEVDRSRRERSEAWRRLGECQAMNEKEAQAIRALEEAIKIDENNLEAYMSLAISYTNEGYDTAAHQTLERYISRAYPHLKAAPLAAEILGSKDPIEGTTGNPWASLNRVTDLFLQAAREGNAAGQVDPEVQVGLGVLFYTQSSYEQAQDCFNTALSARPNDFLLWNRLGATLANGGKPEEAIAAYHKALELRPTFTRAIYNLSVSCLNLGAHHEAAEHLLAALSLQQTHTLPDVPEGEQPAPTPLAEAGESHNLWSTLRRIFLVMDRMDLAQKAHVGSELAQFRGEGFEF
ncbi:peroxisomal targeting signal-1 receptor [Moesziomyces antarcticus]|uniref:Peroxisomal targeting signal-1 receptor n=2 Tax=Pseudozyma antarctica TaxID=84753 RepID=A0A081CD21_PSEA2|nr:peroxisomal targeting signal-1 receptor [Moesziomyces antarcticus]GAK64567.1 peroxisomal targeting signal-1 receptor [Moesziomyces antarcticus]SPO44923.1 related to PEX5 - peroxisomal targeting signal receptor [Moesziomyces antarcticus]